jgi:pantetheine-phosphate adenylyltransferase
MTTACCPGSFDPVTYGHLDIIERASKIFDEVVVAVIENPSKQSLFTLDERVEMLTEVTSHLEHVKIASFQGLLVEFCRRVGAKVLVKGLRAVTDFDYEMQMAQMNARLGVDTAFMATNPEYSYLSSSLMKEVTLLGGAPDGLVPPLVQERLAAKVRARKKGE